MRGATVVVDRACAVVVSGAWWRTRRWVSAARGGQRQWPRAPVQPRAQPRETASAVASSRLSVLLMHRASTKQTYLSSRILLVGTQVTGLDWLVSQPGRPDRPSLAGLRAWHSRSVQPTQTIGLVVIAVVLLFGTLLGAVLRRRAGRLGRVPAGPGRLAGSTRGGSGRSTSGGPVRQTPVGSPDPVSALAGIGIDMGVVTLVQFSSSTCGSCGSASRVLARVAERIPGVRHVELDVERHADIVRALDVWRTPTVLVVDSSRQVTARTVGVPREAELTAVVRPLLPAGPTHRRPADA